MDINKYLVLVGVSCKETNYTNGTGFLVSKGEKTYVATCRHVANSMKDFLFRFAIPAPKKSMEIPYILNLGNPIYHIEDTDELNSDVCLIEVLNYKTSELNLHGIYALDHTMLIDSTVPEFGNSIKACGYPKDYITPYLSENKVQEDLPYKTIFGIVHNTLLGNITGVGFDGIYRTDIAKTACTNGESLGVGASGCPVISVSTGLPCGVLTSETNGVSLSSNEDVHLIVFTPISYIVDILNSL